MTEPGKGLPNDGTPNSGADGQQTPLSEQDKESSRTRMAEQDKIIENLVAEQENRLRDLRMEHENRLREQENRLASFLNDQDEKFRKMMPITTEEAEALLGALIRVLNPYTDIMHYPPGNPMPSFAEQTDCIEQLKTKLARPRADKLAQFQFEVDNRYGAQNSGEYLSWEFKREPQIIKKAVKIQFRHPEKDGGWIIDHLLIGFAGSNGP